MDPNPYSPPRHQAAPVAASARRAHVAGAASFVLAGPLLFVGLLQISVWSEMIDHLENVSPPSNHPEMVQTIAREWALARAGQAATLLDVLLGAALIPLGFGQVRCRRWARSTTLIVAILAMTLSAAMAGLLLWAGVPPDVEWLFLFMPPLLAGVAEFFSFSRSMRSSCLEPPGRPPVVE